MPARATMMTGVPAYVHGATANTDAEPMRGRSTLPGMLTAAGYQTRAQGKMHFHPMRHRFGFETMELSYDYYRFMQKYFPGEVGGAHGYGQNELEPILGTAKPSQTLTRWVVDRSVDFLETRDSEKPFFLWSSISKPHPPLDPSPEFWEIYRDIPMPDPVIGDWAETVEGIPAGFLKSTCSLGNGYRFSQEQWCTIRRAYYACISEVDAALGILFSRMRELGLLDNTWIIFTSDHGEMLGDHHMSAKNSFFEGSAHIPLLIRPPGQWDEHPLRGRVCDALVSLQDIFPTCMNLADCGESIPREVSGNDLLEVANGARGREAIVGVCGEQYAVIERDWKYLFSSVGGSCLLFNLANDPGETVDVSRADPERCARMHRYLLEELSDRGKSLLRGGEIPETTGRPLADERRWNSWPGFHSFEVETDLLH
tara:strand:- start:7717 stop:8994 length:1278 start_codon:yes stop_codon:yes gene_type:complete